MYPKRERWKFELQMVFVDMQFVLSCSSGVVGCAMMMSVEQSCNFHTNVILLMLIFWWTFSHSVVLRSDCTHTKNDMYENSKKKIQEAAWTLLSVHSTFPNFFFNRFRGNISLFFRFHFQAIFLSCFFSYFSRQQIFHFNFFHLFFFYLIFDFFFGRSSPCRKLTLISIFFLDYECRDDVTFLTTRHFISSIIHGHSEKK